MVRVPRAFLEFLAPSLRTLDLSHNRLTEIDRSAFKQLSLLQVLKIADNSVMELSKTAFHSLTGLQVLEWPGNAQLYFQDNEIQIYATLYFERLCPAALKVRNRT